MSAERCAGLRILGAASPLMRGRSAATGYADATLRVAPQTDAFRSSLAPAGSLQSKNPEVCDSDVSAGRYSPRRSPNVCSIIIKDKKDLRCKVSLKSKRLSRFLKDRANYTANYTGNRRPIHLIISGISYQMAVIFKVIDNTSKQSFA